ncbi:histidinol dehydrogenase [Cystobasidium minutum MCA 4210]|uniref:histidinol dehydrogenase n=1 Tax=Cystobasidium minutum MCA 4210 TaxID=1397322 RepID=UPI0034CEE301|eukprot:jgi/Rhomi1/156430/estExt_Genewise1Plus.C_1_t10035
MAIHRIKSAKPPAQNGVANPSTSVADIVSGVIEAVKQRGDEAVREYALKFDKMEPKRLSKEEAEAIIAQVDPQTIKDIKEVQENVRNFALAQKACLKDLEVEIRPGVILGHKNVPIDTVGCYIPGGRYPLLASAHMTILTAKAAGVRHVVACTPPILGEIPKATVAAMYYAGADDIWILGGTQAIAAMAVGTEAIPQCHFLAGPGNAFVAEAKRQVFGPVGIDLFAGPTEVLIVADDKADPLTCATDLLSQAEHGPDTPAVLITTSKDVAEKTLTFIDTQLESLRTADIASVSWRDHGEVIVTDTIDEAYALADDYASEHVQILTETPRDALTKMQHYGALFLGKNTCVSYGDKCIGTNHVLPTRKTAHYTGGLWVGKFLKTCSYQEVVSDKASGELGRLCGRAARAENFEGHARSGDLRAHLNLQDKFDWIP